MAGPARTDVVHFSAADVAAQRGRAWDAWMDAVAPDTPQGWSVSPVDLAAVVAGFPALRLRDGYSLQAYQHRRRGDGSGVVYALPAGAQLPAPGDAAEEPPRPEGALGDFMEAIVGDGSPESYLQASLLARELAEIGAVGHGVAWLAHTVLGGDPWLVAHDWLGPVEGPATPREDWEWLRPAPEDWRPGVLMGPSPVLVFFSFSALGGESIRLFEDLYPAGSLVFKTAAQDIARGGPGFML